MHITTDSCEETDEIGMHDLFDPKNIARLKRDIAIKVADVAVGLPGLTAIAAEMVSKLSLDPASSVAFEPEDPHQDFEADEADEVAEEAKATNDPGKGLESVSGSESWLDNAPADPFGSEFPHQDHVLAPKLNDDDVVYSSDSGSDFGSDLPIQSDDVSSSRPEPHTATIKRVRITMEQAQQKTLVALQPYLLAMRMVSTANGAAEIIKQATSAPDTYVFGELLEHEHIQALDKDKEHYGSLILLRIFAYGMYNDYLDYKDDVPELNAAQTIKLRQLTLLRLCQTAEELTYASLCKKLSVSRNELESLVIDCMYAGMLLGKLDPLARRVRVIHVLPIDDLKQGSLPLEVAIIEEWGQRAESVEKEVQAYTMRVKQEAFDKRLKDDADERQQAKLMEAGEGKAKRAVEDTNAEMDLGDDEAGIRARNAKRGGKQGFMGVGNRLGSGD